MEQQGMFDLEHRYRELSEVGDPLEKLNRWIPWATFRPILEQALLKERSTTAGRKRFDVVMMFKVLVLQHYYNLSDGQTEYQIKDRLSFMRFVGLALHQRVPDEKTIWLFREQLTQAGVIQRLFARMNACLAERGYQAKQGQLVDASIVETQRRRQPPPADHPKPPSTESVQSTEPPPEEASKPHQMRQIDTDASWAKRGGNSRRGYKNHVNVDAKHKLIREYVVTGASVHDSQVLRQVVQRDGGNRQVYADKAYRSRATEQWLREQGLHSRILYKASVGRVLTPWWQHVNGPRARVRCRVEHVFGQMRMRMGIPLIRTVGLVRATAKLGLFNLVYNFCRFAYLQQQASPA